MHDGKDETKEEGVVLAQTPEVSETKKIKENSEITLVVNVLDAEGEVPVPDVKAWKQADAEKEIKNAGLVPKITPVADDDTAEGYVKTTDPAPTTKVKKGSTVTLFVSTGPSDKKTTVPNVIYDNEATARQKIEAAGLKVGNVEPRYSNQDAGIVIETNPLPTTSVSEGSTVNLVISKGPEPPQEKTYSVYVNTSGLSHLNFDMELVVYVDGAVVKNITINPALGGGPYDIPVTGTTNSGKKTVLAVINGYPYYQYEVDFGNDGVIDSWPRSDFVEPKDPNASVDPGPPSGPEEPSGPNGNESGQG